MSDTVKSAVVAGLALVVAAILMGGFYQVVAVDDKDVGLLDYRLSRFTGSVALISGGKGFIDVRELPRKEPIATPSPSS
jgi:hypothetical protein